MARLHDALTAVAAAASGCLALPLACPGAAAPTNPQAANPFNFNGTTVEVSWEDNSDDEDGFEVEVRFAPDGPVALMTPALRNQTLASFVGGGFGLEVYLRVRAVSSTSGNSGWTQQVMTKLPTTDTAIRAGTFHGGVAGEPITPYLPQEPDAEISSPITSYSAIDLPDGFSIDPATGRITGTPGEPGFFRVIVEGTDGASTTSTFVTFRIVAPRSGPVEIVPVPDLDLTIGANPTVALVELDDYVLDPDTEAAARMVTNRGTIDIILYPRTAPATVENFLGYVRRGDLDATVFHRSVAKAGAGLDIIQSGWFKPTTPPAFQVVDTEAQGFVPNEPGQRNVRGTIAMAKTSDPDSATSQTFFNVSDSPPLDTDRNSGGFSVFGRASDPSLAVIDDIHARPTGTYMASLSGVQRTLNNWPTNGPLAQGATPGPDDLVQVLTLTELASPLSYAIAAPPDPAVAGAAVTDSALVVTPLGPGETAFSVSATDLDGQSTTAEIRVSVNASYAGWAAGFEFPGGRFAPSQDGEPDGYPNVSEYAFLGNPVVSDAAAMAPVVAVDGEVVTVTFNHRRWSPDLSYAVESGDGLSDWSTVWQSSDGTGHPAVHEVVESPQSWRLSVGAPLPAGGTGQLYLRVRVVLTGWTPPLPEQGF
jgi:cyclophilin family peptidyl-prolyl cis-trans isomerase